MAKGYNKVILMGNLAADPQVRYTASKQAVASFSVAVNRSWKDKNGEMQEAVDFIPVVVWGSLASIAERYLSKGKGVLVEGRLQVRNYEAKTGERRYVTEVIASEMTLLPSGGKRDDDGAMPKNGESRSFRDDSDAPFGGFGESFPMDISEVGHSSPDDEVDIPF